MQLYICIELELFTWMIAANILIGEWESLRRVTESGHWAGCQVWDVGMEYWLGDKWLSNCVKKLIRFSDKYSILQLARICGFICSKPHLLVWVPTSQIFWGIMSLAAGWWISQGEVNQPIRGGEWGQVTNQRPVMAWMKYGDISAWGHEGRVQANNENVLLTSKFACSFQWQCMACK